MYTVLIVDDEPIICQGLRSKISRINNNKINTILECYSSEEAIMMIENKKIDIIITDVKMPGMNGIELIQEIIQENNWIKFIVLSGYDDYNYVRDAFKNGAVDYMLKPASIPELKERLESVIHLIEKQKNALQQKVEDQRKQLNEQTKSMFDIIINSKEASKEIYDKLTESYPYPNTGLALFYNYNAHNAAYSKEKIHQLIVEKQCVCFNDVELKNGYFYNAQGVFVCLFNYQEATTFQVITDCINDMLKEMKKDKHQCICSMSNCDHHSMDNIKELYRQAIEALSYKIIHEPFSLIQYSVISNKEKQWVLSKEDLDLFEDYIQTKNFYQLSNYINHYFTYEKLQDATIYNIEKLYTIVLQKINRLLNNYDLVNIDLYNKGFYDFESLVDMRVYLKQCILFIQQQAVENENTMKSVVDIAIQYVEENYEKDINMADIANMVAMNYSYFSKLFKDEMKISFKKYLMKIRMEHARTFLQDPKRRIQEVAMQVGYDNPQNFSRAFKSYYGFSPKDYRNSI